MWVCLYVQTGGHEKNGIERETNMYYFKKKKALAGVAQLVIPRTERVASSIPGQGT